MPLANVLVTFLLFLPSAPLAAQTARDPDALEQRATELFSAGKTNDAIAAFEQLRTTRRASGERALEARALWRLALAYRGAGRTDDAIRAGREAFRLARSANAGAIAAEAIGQLQQLNAYVPEFPDASRALDEMLRLARASSAPRTAARALDLRARWLGDAGDTEGAIAALDQGIGYATTAGDDAQLASLYAVRSTMTNRAGRLGDALADALRSRDAAAKVGPRAEVTALFALAQVQSHLSNSEEAVRLWTEVLDRYRAIGPPIGVVLALDARTHVQYDAGHYEASLADGVAAIAAYENLKQRPAAPMYSRAGMASIRLGRDSDARTWLAQAAARLEAAPEYEQIQTLTQLGIAHVMLGEFAEAERYYTRMLQVGRKRGSVEDEWKAELGLGRVALAAHDPTSAIAHLERAATLIERLRTTVPAQELRAAYLSRRVEAHEWLVTALMMDSRSPGDQRVEQAFNVAERARVRALADLLAEGRAKRRSTAPAPAPRARRREEIAAGLGPGDVLVEYLVGEERAYGWVLSRDRLIGFDLPAPADLDADVRQALTYIDRDDREGLRRISEALTPALLGPVLDQLPGLRRLIFVPDGPLQRLPFAALSVPGGRTYLAQYVATSTVGSGSLLSLLDSAEPASGERVLALSSGGDTPATNASSSRALDAPLPDAAGEAADAVAILGHASGANAMTEATESAVKQSRLADYRVIHVAAHSLIDETFPRNSAILLRADGADDGALRAAEISQIPVRADLVVLAACRTQFGRILRGEGLLSLARSFMEAGARSVMASLWDVGDRDTRVLMRSFYAGIAGGLPPDQALRMSQLQMIRSGGSLAAPKVWAAFQVTGEGRRSVWQPRSIPMSILLVILVLGLALGYLMRR